MTKAKDLQSEISKILDKNVILGKNGAIIKHELIFQAILALIKKHEKGVIEEMVKSDALTNTAWLARIFHAEYEGAAEKCGWKTNKKTQVVFDQLPRENINTMLLTCKLVLWHIRA